MNKITAMSRGIIVIDENLSNLAKHLQKRNIKVVLPPKAMSDDDIMSAYLSHRIFITANTKDFIEHVSSFEFGLISADNVKNKNPAELAKTVSDAVVKYSLWSKRHGFLLVLKKDGMHEYKDMVE